MARTVACLDLRFPPLAVAPDLPERVTVALHDFPTAAIHESGEDDAPTWRVFFSDPSAIDDAVSVLDHEFRADGLVVSRAAVDDEAPVRAAGHPVAVVPDPGEAIEVGDAVALAAGVVPEAERRRREGARADQLAGLAGRQGATRGVEDLDRLPQQIDAPERLSQRPHRRGQRLFPGGDDPERGTTWRQVVGGGWWVVGVRCSVLG